MTQSPTLRFFKAFRDKPKTVPNPKPDSPPPGQDNVEGWLLSVHNYRDNHISPINNNSTEIQYNIVDADNNCIPTENSWHKKGRPGSIASEDSVNLEELINANFTVDMDDETDLPDLADLDLDDSTDDFWKLESAESLSTLDKGFNEFITKTSSDQYDLDWTPTDNKIDDRGNTTPANDAAYMMRHKRSDSLSSENSLTSQSTITRYSKYGMTPMIYPSESSSTSSRSISRTSNYSASSSASGIPISRCNIGIPTPSRSSTVQKYKESRTINSHLNSAKSQRTQLNKRASHIPAPASYKKSPPTPQATSSSSSVNGPTHSRTRMPQRASHIPTVRESAHTSINNINTTNSSRPGSPLNAGRTQPSRIGLRSPTPGPRNTLFSETESAKSSSTPNNTRGEVERVLSPTNNRPSGLRPPGSIRPSSRLRTIKKS
ncbi:hypothetical protein BDB01DRAFT_778995 [Pilobolus umbonatus]|nr:hypothetical protein BDB01DRAFT_778995 [Pilobolus umbonatus]